MNAAVQAIFLTVSGSFFELDVYVKHTHPQFSPGSSILCDNVPRFQSLAVSSSEENQDRSPS